jgi:hypothetical protein
MPIHPEVRVFILVYMRLSVVFKVLLFCTLYSNLVSILYIESIPHVALLLYLCMLNQCIMAPHSLDVLLIESKYYVSSLQYILHTVMNVSCCPPSMHIIIYITLNMYSTEIQDLNHQVTSAIQSYSIYMCPSDLPP